MTNTLSRCAVMKDPLAHALAEATAVVKAENLDAWLSLLLARAAARPALLGAWALMAETTRLPWQLHEPLLCRLRMEFWRSMVLEEEAPALPDGTMPELPPLLALWPPALPRVDMGEALAHFSLLADGALGNVDEVRQWSEAAFTPLWRTLLLAACVNRDGSSLVAAPDVQAQDADTALRALARAHGAGFVLRRAPWSRRSTSAALLSDEVRQHAPRLVQAAERDFIFACRHAWPRHVLPALWPARLMHQWLKQAARQPHFPHKPMPAPSQLSRQWLLLQRWLRGRL